jgi:hypothetical protein
MLVASLLGLKFSLFLHDSGYFAVVLITYVLKGLSHEIKMCWMPYGAIMRGCSKNSS